MKKISSKIIVSILLAIFLWSGVGGFLVLNLEIKQVSAQTDPYTTFTNPTGGLTIPTSNPVGPTNSNVPSGSSGAGVNNTKPITDQAIADCQEQFKGDATAINNCIENIKGNIEQQTGFLAFMKSFGKNMASAFSSALIKTVMSVNGIILQFIIVPILSTLFTLSANLLDMTTGFTLSSNLIKSSGVSLGITTTWSLIRNICNITFIFILLWTAIQTIIGIAGVNTKKMIASVIIAALLINFSLFVTRILIDAGNILAVSLYNALGVGTGGLGSLIMQKLGLVSFWGTKDTGAVETFSVAFGVISWLQVITLLTGFIVFMYAALLMAVRTVVLIFLMALSPIGFMGDVLPQIAEYSKIWWKTLYGQIIIAPIFLLFVSLILKIASAFGDITTLPEDTKQYAAYFKYVMIIMLLIVAVKTTKKMAGPIGAAIEKYGSIAAGAALGFATGGVAFAGRTFLGRAAAQVATGEGTGLSAKLGKGLQTLSSKGGLGGTVSQFARNRFADVSKSTFDVRNTSSFKSVTDEIAGQTGIKVDYDRGIKMKKGGYDEWQSNLQKQEVERAKSLGPTFSERQAGDQYGMYKDRNKLVDEKAKKEKEITDANATIRSLEAEERSKGVNNSDKIFNIKQTQAKNQERITEIDEAVKETEDNFKARFNKDLAALSSNDAKALKAIGDKFKDRQKNYVESLEKAWPTGPMQGVIANLDEKRRLAEKIRKEVMKKDTDMDKLLKGIKGSTAPAPSATPPAKTP
jgi:hypothetical protein